MVGKNWARDKSKENLWCYIFLAPTVILFCMFTVYPAVASWVISFFNWTGMEPLIDFVGWRNFIEVATDPGFWNAFKNSFVYMLGVVPIQLSLALLGAIVLNNPELSGTTIYRTLLFLPVITTTSIVGIIMSFIFGTFNGVVNEILMALKLIAKPVNWLGSTSTAMGVVILVGIWKTYGYNLIYWLAGLQSIPKELYEAAKVDGANKSQQFCFITLPLLKPIAIVILLLAIVGSLNVFDLVKVMTNGGPAYATDVVATYIYRFAFSTEVGVPRLGFACAAGVFYGVATMFIALLQAGLMKRVNQQRQDYQL